jgi:tetratricopeptide (TPR) repeat protein
MNKVVINTIFCLFVCVSISAQDTLYEQSRTLYINEQYEEALPLIKQCIENDSINYHLYVLQGKIQENLYKYKSAIDSYNHALRLNKANSEAKSALASLYLKIGQPEISEKLYSQLVKANPEVNRWKIHHANILLQLRKYEESLCLLQDVVSKDSLNWIIHRNMGNCYFKLNQFDSAVVCFRKSLNIYPNNTSYINLMKINIKQKNYTEAIKTGYEAVQVDSTKIEIWENIGLAFFLTGLNQNSIDAFNKILELGDTTYTTANHLGYLYYVTESYSKAVTYLDIALKHQPDELETMFILAKASEKCAEYDKSISVIAKIQEKVNQLDSLAINAEIIRGNVYRRKKRYEDAIKVYSAVLKVDPSHTVLMYTVAQIYDTSLNNKKNALKWYTRYLNNVFPEWEKKEPSQRIHYFVKNRIEELKIDLFFEKEPDKQ